MVKRCLSLRPDSRPTLAKIMSMEAISKRLNMLPPVDGVSRPKVLDTIELPVYKHIGDVRLPPAMYTIEHGELELLLAPCLR